MKRIAYISSIPWGWIKQRPQFLAEYLSNKYEVDVFYKKSNTASSKILINPETDELPNLRISSFRYIPFHKIPILKWFPLEFINKLFVNSTMTNLDSYDFVWYASSSSYRYTKHLINSKKTVIYDCMDDCLEFPNVAGFPAIRERVLREENILLQRANHVFVSAEYLAEKIIKRSNISRDKVTIVNNAIEMPRHNEDIVSDNATKVISFLKEHKKTLLYIGTIEKWFDFDMIIEVLNRRSDYHLVLLGPAKNGVPQHDRIHHLGLVQHSDIFHIMPLTTALVMPFQVTELIKAVNPVKLYEYIYSGVPVIATSYGETQKFKKFVKLYNDSDDFVKCLDQIESEPRHTIEECREFVSNNTWKNRVIDISKVLNQL